MPVAAEHAAGSPFYFAWVDADETTFNSGHHRYDEYIFSFSITQNEGDFAILSIDIKNPGVGLFAPGRKIWAWFARDDYSSEGISPIFFGRVVGIPSDLLAQVVTIQLTARPVDLIDQKAALAATLKVLPYYDDIFVDPAQRENPDTVLEGYSALWAFDRVTHEVSVSDILVGEDGTLTFATQLYDNLVVTVDGFPQSSVSFDASVTWQQQASGTIPLQAVTFNGYTAVSMAQAWPKDGQSIGAGWSVDSASAVLSLNANLPIVNWQINYHNEAKTHNDGDTMSVVESYSGPYGYRASDGITLTQYSRTVVGDPYTGTPASAEASRTAAVLGVGGAAVCSLSLRYDMNRKREEHVLFTLSADLQPVIHDDPIEADGPVVISGVDVGIPIGDGTDATPPLLSGSASSYFPTARGLQSLEHLLLRARAKLLLSSRVGRVSWDVPLSEAIDISCRKNAIIVDPRVSGGEPTIGKVIAYELAGNGDDAGSFIGKITIGCAVGKGTAIETSAGTADYITDDYIDPGYYAHDGVIVAASSGDIGYTPPVYETGDNLVLPLTAGQVIVRQEVTSSLQDQNTELAGISPPIVTVVNPLSMEGMKAAAEARIKSITDAVSRTQQTFELELKSVTGSADPTEYQVDTTILSIPEQIDLGATGASL